MSEKYILIMLSFILGVTTANKRFECEASSRATEIKCGDIFPNQCQQSRYRTLNGSCNNLLHPTWGMPFTRYGRLLAADYADGIHAPRKSRSGKSLPLARILSTSLDPNTFVLDVKYTLVTMQFGQAMSHDMSKLDERTETPDTQCCSSAEKLDEDYLKKPSCYPIIIPDDDPGYKNSGIQCLHVYNRTNTDLDRGCSTRGKAAEQLTTVTQSLDLSLLYGSSDEEAASLREGKGGRLTFEKRNNHDWLPIVKGKYGDCYGKENVCYRAGDERINQNLELTILHIILLREHNRVATAMVKLNSHWTDEKIYQETRRILIALFQFISYYEWLPIILGLENCIRNKLIYITENYVNDYDPSVDPSILNEFASAAFRSFHTTIAGNLQLINEARKSASSSVRLSDHFQNPTIVEKSYDDLARGLFTQAQEASDKFHTKEITVFLAKGHKKVGNDLRAFDIQRGRDHGIPNYIMYLSFCGLRNVSKWDDFLGLICPQNVKILSKLYETPDDVDLAVGAMLENNMPGTLVGSTYHCLLTHQFFKSRVGDRFWFENGNNGAAFTLGLSKIEISAFLEQLEEIRKASISRLLCDNGNDIQSIQLKGFEQISEENPLKPCKDIPSINLTLWKENSDKKNEWK